MDAWRKLRRSSRLKLLLVSPLLLLGSTWNGTFEGLPPGTEALSNFDNRMRDLKLDIRERGEAEICWGTQDPNGCDNNDPTDTATSDTGRLREGACRGFFEAAEPTVLYSLDFAGGAALDDGRIWVDSDTNLPHVFDAAANDFERLNVDDDILFGNYNTVYNGSFEATSGSGLVTANITIPAGVSVFVATSPTYTYAATDDTRYGNGVYVQVANAGAVDEGIQFAIDNLKSDTVYKLLARARDDGTAVCLLDVTGEGGTAFTPVSTTTDAWQTLSGTFDTTAGTVDDVAITLVTDGADATNCDWDHITLVEQGNTASDRAEVSEDGIVRVRASRAAGAGNLSCSASYAGNCLAANSGLEVYVTPPGPNYLITVDASVILEVQEFGDSCLARLTIAGASTLDELVFGGASSNLDVTELTVKLHGTVVNPAAGVTLNFEVDGSEIVGSGAGCILEDGVIQWIEAVMIPIK